jgi:hypothetical protein
MKWLPFVVIAWVSLGAACGNVVVDRALGDAAGVAVGAGAGSSAGLGAAPGGSTVVGNAGNGAGAATTTQPGSATTGGFGGAAGGGSGNGAACSTAGMLGAPIKLPSMAAKLDLVQPNNQSLTLEAAEQIDCACKLVAGESGTGGATGAGGSTNNGELICSWGPNAEVWATYEVAPPHAITGLTLWPGYTGTLEATSPDGAHHFTITVAQEIARDGEVFALDWAHPNTLEQQLSEVTAALYATYAPGALGDPSCTPGGVCQVTTSGDSTVITFGLGLTLWMPKEVVTDPVPSVVNLIDIR